MNDMTLLTKIVVGNDYGAPAIDAAIGKTISSMALTDDVLHMTFTDGYELKISDEGQSCCESRYMTTDDAMGEYVGAVLISVSVLDAPNIEQLPDETGYCSDEEHEVQFLRITTSKGDVTFASHNEHSGYYGGFSIHARGQNT
jgi:hypothetical protein